MVKRGTRAGGDAPGSGVFHLHFRAMSCEMAAWVIAADARIARAHLEATREFIETVEAHLSRFRPESELSRLNARAGQEVAVSPLLWEVLEWALEAARRTEGVYDPTVLDALEAAGYDRSFDDRRRLAADPRNDDRLVSTPHRPSAIGDRSSAWQAIRLNPHARSVTLPPGVRLDLGGVAKGWTAERAADRLARLGPCLVDAGGDIAARGSPPGEPGWPIAVADPRDPDADLALLIVRDRGVATSGIDYRRWVHNGTLQHHLIDPRTGRPAATDLLTATVVAPDATEADLHALVALLLGAEDGVRYLLRQKGVEGLLVRDTGDLLTTPGFERYVVRWM